MNHNGLLLLGAVKTAGGREGGEGCGRGKGSGGCGGSKVQRGDVEGKVKGEGREEEAKTGERGGMKPGRKKRHELGSKEEEGRMRGGKGAQYRCSLQKDKKKVCFPSAGHLGVGSVKMRGRFLIPSHLLLKE